MICCKSSIVVIKTLFVLIFLCNVSVSASTDAATVEYNKAIKKFGEKNYIDALSYFLSAKELGFDSSKLHYNLGVTYYRLKKFDAALKELSYSAENPQLRSLAHFNAGLVYIKQNNLKNALRQFQLAGRTSISNKQSKLASLALQKYSDLSNKFTSENSRIRLQVDYGRSESPITEISDGQGEVIIPNLPPSGEIAQPPSTQTKTNNVADYFFTRYIELEKSLKPNLNIKISEYRRNYNVHSINNYLRRKISMGFRLRRQDYVISLGIEFDAIYTSGQTYLDSIGVVWRSSIRTSQNGYLRSLLSGKKLSTRNKEKYYFLEGKQNWFKLKYVHRYSPKMQFGLDYQYIYNKRENFKNLDVGFISYSPSTQKIGVSTNYIISKSLWVIFESRKRWDKYLCEFKNEPLGCDAASQVPMGNNNRSETRMTWRASIKWRIDSNFSLHLSYERLNHKASYPGINFKNTILFAGVVLNY